MIRGAQRSAILTVLAAIVSGLTAPMAAGDVFRIVNREGRTEEIEARLAGEGQGALALELPNGHLQIIPLGAVQRRTPAADPEPLKPADVAKQLESRFEADKYRSLVQGSYVIGLILQEPIAKSDEVRVGGFLKKTAKFMRNVEGVFLSFARELRLPVVPPKFPLVVLIFESDDDFEQYAAEVTGGRGLSAGNIAGFYAGLSNELVLRLSECHTFETPLHEAVHQQVHNRGILQRLAPIPVWFNEGIATGFEGNAQRISIGPTKIAKRYARIARSATRVNWNSIVNEDSAFRGDILAGEAYGHAWGMHWLLVTEHKLSYMKYVQALSRLQPLSEQSAEQRMALLEEHFGKSPEELQTQFGQALESGIRRQRIRLEPTRSVGLSHQQTDMAEVAVNAVSTNGILQVEGQLKNISPIRTLAFHVAVVTEAGTFTNWILPSVRVNQKVKLPRQVVNKMIRGARGGPSNTYRVQVQSVPAGDSAVSQWVNQPPIR